MKWAKILFGVLFIIGGLYGIYIGPGYRELIGLLFSIIGSILIGSVLFSFIK